MFKSSGSRDDLDETELGNIFIDEDNLEESPENNGIIYKIFFPLQCLYPWMIPFIYKTFSDVISLNDIPKLKEEYRSMSYLERFKCVRRYLPRIRALRLLFSVFFTYFYDFVICIVLTLALTILNVSTPLVFRMVLKNLQDPIDESKVEHMKHLKDILPKNLHPSEGDILGNFRQDNTSIYIWFGILMFQKLLEAFIDPYQRYVVDRLDMKIKGLLNCAVFEKSVKVTSKSSKQLTKGKMLNFLNIDINVVAGYMSRIHMLWYPILIFATSLYFLLNMIGYSTLIGLFGPFFISVPCFFVIGFFLLILRLKVLKLTDSRIHLMSYSFREAQDSSFGEINARQMKRDCKKVLNIRNEEVFHQRILNLVIQLFFSISKSTPMFILVVIVGSHFVLKGEISEITLYSSFGLLMNLSRIVIVPIFLIAYIIHFPSFTRIDDLLHAKDAADIGCSRPDEHMDKNVIIKLRNATFIREKPVVENGEEEDGSNKKKKNRVKKKIKKKNESTRKLSKDFIEHFELKDLSIKIKDGSFVVITGPSGSGKSSFLHALLQDMTLISGECLVRVPQVSYVSQHPYIMCGTLLQNITFFRDVDANTMAVGTATSNSRTKIEPIDDVMLENVMQKCELSKFPLDMNLGESSLKLNLQQRFHVSFARCLYSTSKLVFVDDPLAQSYSREIDTPEKIHRIVELLLSVSLTTSSSSEIEEEEEEEEEESSSIFGRTLVVTVDSSRTSLLESLLPHATMVVELKRDGVIGHCGPPTESMVGKFDLGFNDDDDITDSTTTTTTTTSDDDMMNSSESSITTTSNSSYSEGEEEFYFVGKKRISSPPRKKPEGNMLSSEEMDLIFDSVHVSSSSDEDDDINRIIQDEEQEEEEEGGEEMKSSNTTSSSGYDSSSSSSESDSDDNQSSSPEKRSESPEIIMKKARRSETMNPEERPTGSVPIRIIFSFFRFMMPCKNLILTFILLAIIYIIDTSFRTGTQWYLTNMSSGLYFHQKFGNGFYSSYYTNTTISDSQSLIQEEKTYHYFNESFENCPVSTEKHIIECEHKFVEIFWSKSFKNETIVKEGISYRDSFFIFVTLAVLNTFVSLIRIVILSNLFLNSSNYFFTIITNNLYSRFIRKRRFKNDDNFFNEQPVGRLVARLSRDIGILDRRIGRSFDMVISTVMTGIFSVFVMAISTYGLALIPLSAVVPVYICLFMFYHRTPRDLRRIQSIARSRVYVSLETAISGRTVIQAYGKCALVSEHHCKKYVDVKNRVEFMKIAAASWFFVNTYLLGVLLFFGITMSSIILVYYFEVSYVFLLLAINYSGSLAMFLGGFFEYG